MSRDRLTLFTPRDPECRAFQLMSLDARATHGARARSFMFEVTFVAALQFSLPRLQRPPRAGVAVGFSTPFSSLDLGGEDVYGGY